MEEQELDTEEMENEEAESELEEAFDETLSEEEKKPEDTQETVEIKSKLIPAEVKFSEDPSKTKITTGLSTGITLLNLALTGNINYGIMPGTFNLFVGKSKSGKTWSLQQLFAEACINPRFKDYKLVYDNGEKGARMDLVRYFGQKMKDEVKEPNNKGSSSTVEEFYDNIDDIIKSGKSFIYGLDSESSLTSEYELKKAAANKKTRRRSRGDEKEEDVKGSYGDGKAKVHSSGLRRAIIGLEKTKSILVMISQSRDNIGPDAMFNPETRAGGRALTFYSCHEIWFGIKEKIKRQVLGKLRTIGSTLKVDVKKNRVSGRDRSIEIVFYQHVGFDDVGSNVRYLVKEGYWKGTEEKVTAPEFDYEGNKEKLIRKIEEEDRENELKMYVGKRWLQIETACAELVKRKRKYE